MTTTPQIGKAATAILVRPAPSRGFEVLLTRRPPEMTFLGGMYVFPGGSVRKADYSERMLARCYGLSANEARRILGAHLAPELALGHWIAALRELYEEVAVLLAAHEDGRPLGLKNDGIKGGFVQQRDALLKGAKTFQAFMESERLFCDASRMAYFSHWQTPEEFPTRYDTRFFLAPLPEDQTPLASSQEVAESSWMTPDRALALFNEGELPLIFPTFASLRTLADFDSLESLFKEYRR